MVRRNLPIVSYRVPVVSTRCQSGGIDLVSTGCKSGRTDVEYLHFDL